MELEGRLKVNEASMGISDDNNQPLFKVENEDVLHGNTPWDLNALPIECRGSTSSDTILRDGVCDYQREGNLLCKPSKEGPVKHYIEQRCESGKHYTPYIKYTKLYFKVDTFLTVGSPLGVFLALRNVRIRTVNGQEYWQDEVITEEMPAYRQMLNIFHPYDLVTYRLEPLLVQDIEALGSTRCKWAVNIGFNSSNHGTVVAGATGHILLEVASSSLQEMPNFRT
eukprot:Gb_15964 [translate_table: standard]